MSTTHQLPPASGESDYSGPRIIFAGTPDFAVPPLQCLLDRGQHPVAVLTQPDRPAGRGRQLQSSPVKQVAVDAGITVFQPKSLRHPEAQQQLSDLRPDLMIVVAYGLILPANVLAIPRLGCWNIHASLLPRWRGAAPIQRAIEAGDSETGICIMQMDEGLDTGPVLLRVPCPISDQETGGSLHDKLAELGAETLANCLDQLATETLPAAVPQPESGITYASKLVKSEAEIDWFQSAEAIERRIRAFNPWPVAWCMMGGERTRIWAANAIQEAHSEAPGTALGGGKAGIDVACGGDVLRITELQRPGGRRISAENYLNARELPDQLGI